ncbi:MAG: hypothetical protein AAFZ65_13500 [Planctomycetota bacterium]
MFAGAIVGVLVEDRTPTWLGMGVALALSLLVFRRARGLAALRSTRWWRVALLAALVAGALLAALDRGAPAWLAPAAPLALGEAGAIVATDAPWSRAYAGWRPVFRMSVRLFGVVAALALVTRGDFVGMANGSLVAVLLGLMALPLCLRAPAEVLVDGRSVPAVRARCPRCGVPVDWPREGPGTCVACGLILRQARSGEASPKPAGERV